ncbi:MAG: hypothetical protein NC347_13360 [Clostridium sp.]|nr:hypothetical protein [Clostridium sp.]
MKIVCNIDRTQYRAKPEPEQIRKIQCNLETPQEIDVQDLFSVICSGGSFRTAAIRGNSDKDFISQQLFAVDIDNAKDKEPIAESDRLTPGQAISKARAAGLTPNFIYPTFSDSPALRKYRILFLLDIPIIETGLRGRIADYITSIFGVAADSKCRNPARLFFGTDKPPILTDTDHINHIADIERLLPDIPMKEPPKAKSKPKRTAKPTSKAESGRKNNIELIKGHEWGELQERIGSKEKKIFDNVADFKAEIWKNADIAELLEIDTPKSFCCIFHEDNSPSASIYYGDCGKWLYKCHSSNCKYSDKALTIHSIIANLANIKAWEAWEAIKQIYNYEVLRTPQSERLQGELLEIAEILDTLDETGFNAQCPIASKNVRYAVELYHHILRIAGRNISPYTKEDKVIFFFSLRQLANESGRSPNKANKINQYITMLAYHGMIEKLPDEQVPIALLKKAYDHTKDNQRHIQFYALQGWNNDTLINIEDNGNRWKKNGYRQNGISYEMFYRTEGEEVASRLYPLSSKTTKEDKVITKKPTKSADRRHEAIMNVCMDLIIAKGYTTEKEIAQALRGKGIGKELSDRQIKRSITDICECNNLTKTRSTKALKEQFNIVSSGYPTIIYRGD